MCNHMLLGLFDSDARLTPLFTRTCMICVLRTPRPIKSLDKNLKQLSDYTIV